MCSEANAQSKHGVTCVSKFRWLYTWLVKQHQGTLYVLDLSSSVAALDSSNSKVAEKRGEKKKVEEQRKKEENRKRAGFG